MRAYIVSLLLVLGAVCSSCFAQSVTLEGATIREGASVRFKIEPQDVKVGAESELALASIVSTTKSIDVGKARPGVYPIRFLKDDGKVVSEGFLALFKSESGDLVAKWEKVSASGSSRTQATQEAFTKFTKGLTMQRIKSLSGPALGRFATENPVQVGSAFVFCVTPGFQAVCVASAGGIAKDCVVEFLTLAADDMAKKGELTKEEAKAIKDLIAGANLIVSIAFDAKDLLKDVRDPNKAAKLAGICEAAAGLTGTALETMDNKELKVGLKAFTDLIDRTCGLIKKPSE